MLYFLLTEGLAVGVGFGAIGKSKAATFESARWDEILAVLMHYIMVCTYTLYAQRCMRVSTHTQTQIELCTHVSCYSHMCCTQTHSFKHTNANTYTWTHGYTIDLYNLYDDRDGHTDTQAQTCTRVHMHRYVCHTQSRTHTHVCTHAHTHTHTHTLALSLSLSLSLSLCEEWRTVLVSWNSWRRVSVHMNRSTWVICTQVFMVECSRDGFSSSIAIWYVVTGNFVTVYWTSQ